MKPSSKPGGFRRRWRSWIALAVIAIAGIFAGWRLLRERREQPVKVVGAAIDVDEKLRLVALKNKALGELENENLKPAFDLLTQIAAELPNDPFGPRNLAVARLVDLEKQVKSEKEILAQKMLLAREATAKLMRMPGQVAIAHWLDARIQQVDDDKNFNFDKTNKLKMLTSAAKLMPDEPALWFEIYSTIVGADNIRKEAEPLRRAHAALSEAYRLAPRNFYVLREWLTVQALANDPTLVDSFEKAKTTFTPLDEVIRREHRNELMPFIAAGIEAVKKGDWAKANTNAQLVSNLVKPDESQLSDVRRVLVHSLVLILTDFAPEFYQDWRPPSKNRPKSETEFSPRLLSLGDGVTDLRLSDFDLDGALDVVVIRPAEALVFGRESPQAPWSEFARCALPDGLTHIYPSDLFRTAETKASKSASGAPATGLIQPAPPPNLGCQSTHQGLIALGAAGIRIMKYDPDAKPPGEALATIEQPAQLSALRDVTQVAPIDFDNDGDLDLAILAGGKLSMWMNRADSTFSPASEWSAMPDEKLSFSSVAAVDFDRDVDLDLILSGPSDESLGLFENLRHGVFRWRPLDEANYRFLRGAEAIQAAEIDGNASWDLIGAGKQGLAVALTMTPATGVVAAKGASREAGSFAAAELIACDYDNDAAIDVLVLSQGKLHAFHGASDDVKIGVSLDAPLLAAAPKDVAAFDIGDMEGDGDLDIVTLSPSGLTLLENRGGENQWLDVLARGESDTQMGRTNHYGIGSLIEVRTKSRYQAQTVDRQITHFGLGQESPADAIRIVWTTGIPQARIEPEKNHRFCEPMILKGSCPYVYTWTGERFEFFTDLLWAAPLGLQQAEGVLAPCRPWEYIKIPGERMTLKNGAYELQVTCELWEADYFDQIELIAIDHLADVEIYSNEKVGPAEIAAFKVHTVKDRRAPVAARDKAGRNVLPLVASADGQFMKGFERTFRQGLTEEHFLELDLGAFETNENITLFLTGWIRPTDTSINVSLSQDPTLEAPRPPYLLAPDANGTWREVQPFMGFPGGKTKTIAIDLAGVFASSDHRLRIATSAEIYWDEAFFTVGERSPETRLAPLELLSADLHCRGFSRVRPWVDSQPETYDYGFVDPAPKWPPMGGMFTRYGEVKPLLTKTDNRLVIMSSGDEVTLRFAPPNDPPPAGWKRDFFMHNRGWDKDADLNTVHGQTVEPLPFAEMKAYPYAPDEDYPDTPELRQWQREYQTRRTDPNAYWRQILRGRK